MFGKEFFVDRYSKLGWNFRNVRSRQAIRLNQNNIKGKNLPDRLQDIGIILEKVPFLEYGYWISNSKVSVGATAEYLLGFYSIQEVAAQIPVTLFTNLTSKSVLDACAAPGGKTVQLANLMENKGTITALDINTKRLAALANHLERCHVRNTIVYNMDARQASKLERKFDCVLLDVPCSGNFAADPRWFRNRTLQDVKRNAALQREILAEALNCLNDQGEIIYSTCSLEPEENELNIDWALKNLNIDVEEIQGLGVNGLTEIFGQKLHASVAHCRRIWPDQTQGFFVAKLRRRNSK